MCLKAVATRSARWNWDGDFIVHKCIVPSSRPVVGFARGHQYDIDVREFLITSRNEVIRRTLDEKIREFVKDRVIGGWEKFQSRDEGSFDFRANVIKDFVSRRISYEPTQKQDPWQFPDETLAVKNGDCEDRALLIASLMIASGISSYNVRVALGRMKFVDRTGHTLTGDHVWVMYKTEVGRWLVIEPTVSKKDRLKHAPVRSNSNYEPLAGEYVPYFVFNDQHLWQVFHESNRKPCTELKLRKTWSEIDPSFAGRVHKSILEEALSPSVCPADIRRQLIKFDYLGYVDPIDLAPYDPLDHFDNGLIAEGWERVANRLKAFHDEGMTKAGIESFAFAAHAIADFYAHTSFVHFSKSSIPCDPSALYLGLGSKPSYGMGTDFDLTHHRFTLNSSLWKKDKDAAVAEFDGQIISGRYAQVGDSVRGGYEERARVIKDLPARCGGLPHHEEIAVDGGKVWDGDWKPSDHKLYQDDETYWEQFSLRKEASIKHVRRAFVENFRRS